MLLLVLSALMVSLASTQFPFAPLFPAYRDRPGNYYQQQQQQQQYQKNLGNLYSMIPSAFVKTIINNMTQFDIVTCTVRVSNVCSAGRRRRGIEEYEQFAPTETMKVNTTPLAKIERNARQADLQLSRFNYYAHGYPYAHQLPLQPAIDGPSNHHIPAFHSQEQVAERQLYLNTITKVGFYANYSVTTITPSCYDATASLLQCPYNQLTTSYLAV